LPASRVSGAILKQCLISDGCVIESGAVIERCVIGVRSRIGRDTVMRDTVVIGADRYETEAVRKESRADIGIGEGCLIERAIVDKDSRIGNRVRLVNQRNVAEEDTPLYS